MFGWYRRFRDWRAASAQASLEWQREQSQREARRQRILAGMHYNTPVRIIGGFYAGYTGRVIQSYDCGRYAVQLEQVNNGAWIEWEYIEVIGEPRETTAAQISPPGEREVDLQEQDQLCDAQGSLPTES